MARNRIIYASQSVWCNGEVLYRVQSLGSTTTFTSEDIFELGHLDIVDVVDDVPAVAVTLNTNDFGDVRTLAILAQVVPSKRAMDTDAVIGNANLKSGSDYLHGVCMADFAITCGNLPGITLWAPVQDECDLGTLTNNIDQTLFLDEVFVNSLEFSYTTGANATENYGAETDNKMWLLNAGRFVNMDSYIYNTTNWLDQTGGTSATLSGIALTASGITIPNLSTGSPAFMRKDTNGAVAVTYYSAGTNEMVNYEIIDGGVATATQFAFDSGDATGVYDIELPTGITPAIGDKIEVVYAGNLYGPGVSNTYFNMLNDANRPSDVGALRQGQAEIYIIDPDTSTSYENAWRLTGCTTTADLTREPLAELGHLSPYDRPLTLPIPITTTVDSTAGDLENWAKFAGQDYTTIDDIDLNDLMNKENLILVIKVFKQTDEEAGGTGINRKALTLAVNDVYFDDGVRGQYAALTDPEKALKTIIVKNLKITDEGMTLDMGANATQTFGFRANNDLFVVKGDLSYGLVAGVVRNA